MKSKIIAPEVGAIVEYGLNSFRTEPGVYRVQSYMRAVEEKPNFDDDVIGEILFDACSTVPRKRMRWCLREEATHVSLAGIAGTIAPIDECKVIGMVEWPESLLAKEIDRAERLGKQGEMLF